MCVCVWFVFVCVCVCEHVCRAGYSVESLSGAQWGVRWQGTGPAYNASGLAPSTTYTFRIRAMTMEVRLE